MSKQFDAIVIGAGMGGLTAANKLAKEGMHVLLLEKHNIPGGAVTTFRRGRFEFEAGPHYFSHYGTKETPQTMYKIVEEFGLADRFELATMNKNVVLKRPGQEDIYLPAYKDESIEYLKKNYPEETAGIDRFFEVMDGVMKDYLEMFQGFDYDYPEPLKLLDPEATPEKYPYFYKYAYMPTMQFVVGECGIKNRDLIFLLTILGNFSGKAQDVIDLAEWLHYDLECPPVKMPNSFQEFSSVLAENVEKYGSTVKYNAFVNEILVEDGKAVGVKTADGDEYRAPIIIYNGSPLTIFRSMVKPGTVPQSVLNEFTSEMKGYDDFDRVGVMAYFGLDCPPEEIGVKDEVVFCQTPYGLFQVECAEAMPEFHKDDECIVSFFAYSSYKDWINVPPEEYHQKKMEIEATALKAAELLFPGFTEHVEEADTFTPLTICRYIGHPAGSLAGFRMYNRDYVLAPMKLNNTLPGLYFAGSWLNNIGCVHPAFASGYGVAKAILEERK